VREYVLQSARDDAGLFVVTGLEERVLIGEHKNEGQDLTRVNVFPLPVCPYANTSDENPEINFE
jgi:hypothetical protein